MLDCVIDSWIRNELELLMFRWSRSLNFCLCHRRNLCEFVHDLRQGPVFCSFPCLSQYKGQLDAVGKPVAHVDLRAPITRTNLSSLIT
jgi:hypothetical protein